MGLGSGIRDPRSGIRDLGSEIRDLGSEIRNQGSGIRDSGSGKNHPDPGSTGQKGTGSRILNTAFMFYPIKAFIRSNFTYCITASGS